MVRSRKITVLATIRRLATRIVGSTAVAVLLSSCSPDGGRSDRPLTVLTWEGYLNTEVISLFTSETGIEVAVEEFSSEEDFEDAVRGAGRYDLIFPSDLAAQQLIDNGKLLPLDHKLLTNLGNIDEQFRNPPFDPGNRFCVPFSFGATGLVINTSLVHELPVSWNILWDDRYQGKVLILDEPRSGFVPALKRLGVSLNTAEPEEVEQAFGLLEQLRLRLKGFTSTRYIELLTKNEAAIAVGYNGDALKAREDSRLIKFIIPTEGTELFIDSVCLPKGSTRTAHAHQFINFLLRPKIAAKFTEVTHFGTPNSSGRELLPPELRNDPSIFPSQDLLKRSEFLKHSAELDSIYEERWKRLKAPLRPKI